MRALSFRTCTALIVAGFSLAACETPTGTGRADGGAVDHFIADKRFEARAFEADGRLAEALFAWRQVASLARGDKETREALARIDAGIEVKVAAHNRTGAEALARGNTRSARLSYLKALALDGDNGVARSALRTMERAHILTKQAEKDAGSAAALAAQQAAHDATVAAADSRLDAAALLIRNGNYRQALALATSFLGDHPGNRAMSEVKLVAFIGMTETARSDGDLPTALHTLREAESWTKKATADQQKEIGLLKLALASDFYGHGKQILTQDIDAAIRSWETAIELNPDDDRSRQQLSRAMRMRQQLNRIKKKPDGR